MEATLSAESGFLESTEGRTRIELVVGVAPDYACIEFPGDLEDLRSRIRPDACGQSIGRVVRPGHRLLGRPEGHYRKDRAEDFFAGDDMGGLDPREEAWTTPIPLVWKRLFIDLVQHGTLISTHVDVSLDGLQLRTGVDRTYVGVLVERVPYSKGTHAVGKLVDDLVGDRFLDEQP